MNQDLKELIESLASHRVEFLVVGSTVLAFYARPRFTEDIDFWVRPSQENVARLETALEDFGLPVAAGSMDAFAKQARQMIVLGAKPQAVDLLNFLDGLEFDAAWEARVEGDLFGTKLAFLSLRDFVQSKRVAGRPKDRIDLALLEEVLGPQP